VRGGIWGHNWWMVRGYPFSNDELLSLIMYVSEGRRAVWWFI
jgi:hypothetical protein